LPIYAKLDLQFRLTTNTSTGVSFVQSQNTIAPSAKIISIL